MPDGGSGFEVNVGGVRDYSGALSEDKALVSEIDGLVSQADVGNESWGIVGLFVHSKYTDMLGDLHDLLNDMCEGLQSGADKMTATADVSTSPWRTPSPRSSPTRWRCSSPLTREVTDHGRRSHQR